MKLENQNFNKLFQTCSKELKDIVTKSLEEDNLPVINKIVKTIKEFRKQTEKTKQFGNQLLSDIANQLKGIQFFNDDLTLTDNYKLLEDQKDILIKNLVQKKYEFTNNQISKMPSKLLFYCLDNYRNLDINEIILDEINLRIENKELDLTTTNVEYLYLYLYMCNKQDKPYTLNKLINNEKFIKALDNANIAGSMIISLTDFLTRPRTILLKKSKKIKESLTVDDELLTPKDILESLTKEEVRILYEDIEIYNSIIEKGLRFDCLDDNKKDQLAQDPNSFTFLDIDTVVTFTNSYKNIKKLANDIPYLLMYLKKLDQNIYDNQIFKYINKETTEELIDELNNINKYSILILLEETNINTFKELIKNDFISNIIKENMTDIIFNKLSKKEQLDYILNKELTPYDIYLLSLLPKKEIQNVFNQNKTSLNALKEYLSLSNSKEIPSILENVPVKILEDIVINTSDKLDSNSISNLIKNNKEAVKLTIINNKEVLNKLKETTLNELLNNINFNENQIIKILKDSKTLTKTVVTKLTNLLSSDNKNKMFNNDTIRNKIIENNKVIDDFTYNYLLTNVEEISKLNTSNIINIINSVTDKTLMKIINDTNIINKLYKEHFNSNKNFIVEIDKRNDYIKYFNKDEYAKYYNRNNLQTLLDSLNIDSKKELVSNSNIIKQVLDNDQDIIKMYNNLISKNNYLLTTLNFNILTKEISSMKTQYVEDIVKYPQIQELIIDINKKQKLTGSFLTYLVNSLTNLDYEKYLTLILNYIKDSVYGKNRNKVTNIFNILPEKITKKETDILVEYLLYINHIKVIETPNNFEELKEYTYNLEEALYKKIHKTEDDNLLEDFLIRHYKLTLKETKEIINKYSISRIDKNTYREEVNFILELNSILNKELHILKEKDGKYKKISMYNSHVMRTKLERMYQTIYNYELKAKAKAGRKIELKSFGKIIPAHETTEDFIYLILDQELNNKENNYLNNYIETISSIDSIKTYLVSNDNLSIKNTNDLIFGFNHISTIINMNKYNSPRELIDNTRENSNEIIISKYDNKNNNKYIIPDYIMIYEENITDELIEKAYRASKELFNIPIIVIKQEKIMDNELKKINELENKFLKTKDVNILGSMITKCANNYTGYSISNKEYIKYFDINNIIKIMEREANRNNSIKALNVLKNIVIEENKKYKTIPYEYQRLIKFINNKIK
ncbi:MAG: hypothetical protein ACI4WW_02390 [Candidatus Coprovivens sp.]